MKEKIQILIIEDNRSAAERLAEIFEEINFVKLCAICFDALSAVDYLRQHTVDLVVTDVEMPGMDGLELIRAMGKGYHFIITSGYRDYAVEGYELDVVDFILKPVTKVRMLRALLKYTDIVRREELRREALKMIPEEGDESVLQIREDEGSYFLMRVDKRIQKARYTEILYARANGDYLIVVTAAKRSMIKMTMVKAEEKLSTRGFLRVHKSYIVNPEFVSAFERYRITLENGEIIPIGKSYWKEVSQALQELAK
jgi:DNA-binding LytR/AlgR family response regulator